SAERACGPGYATGSSLGGCPAELELQLLNSTRALMLDVEGDVRGDAKPLVGHLNVEWCASFERIGKPADLGHELRTGISALDVPVATIRHIVQISRR